MHVAPTTTKSPYISILHITESLNHSINSVTLSLTDLPRHQSDLVLRPHAHGECTRPERSTYRDTHVRDFFCEMFVFVSLSLHLSIPLLGFSIVPRPITITITITITFTPSLSLCVSLLEEACLEATLSVRRATWGWCLGASCASVCASVPHSAITRVPPLQMPGPPPSPRLSSCNAMLAPGPVHANPVEVSAARSTEHFRRGAHDSSWVDGSRAV
jgi:hypothetical protein